MVINIVSAYYSFGVEQWYFSVILAVIMLWLIDGVVKVRELLNQKGFSGKPEKQNTIIGLIGFVVMTFQARLIIDFLYLLVAKILHISLNNNWLIWPSFIIAILFATLIGSYYGTYELKFYVVDVSKFMYNLTKILTSENYEVSQSSHDITVFSIFTKDLFQNQRELKKRILVSTSGNYVKTTIDIQKFLKLKKKLFA